MSNLPSEQPNLSPLDEQLVPYLDGELEPETSKQVEELLAGDETARNRLSQLAASWDLLDQLPRATVDDMFTRTTVQMVAVAAEDELAQVNSALPAVRRRRWLEGALATLMAAVIGFVIVSVGMPSENKALLRDLPVVHNLELYQEAGSLDYLLQLQKSRLISDDIADAPAGGVAAGPAETHPAAPTTAAAAVSTPRAVPKTIDERRAWVDNLSPAEKLELRENFEKFAALPTAQQEALRHFDEQLHAQPNAAQLQVVMQRYYEWLKTLSAMDWTTLKNEASPEQRFARAKELKTSQEQRVFTSLSRGNVVPKDLDNMIVIHWLRKFVEKHKMELDELIDEIRPEPGKAGEPRRGRPPNLLPQAYAVWWAPLATKSAPVSDAEMDSLVAELSPERQQAFAAATDRTAKLSLLDRWIQRAVNAQFIAQGGFRGGRRVNLEGLATFEEHDLTEKQRQELKDLPAGQQKRKTFEWFMQSGRGSGGQRFQGGPQRGGPPDGSRPEGPRPDGPRPDGPPQRNPPPRDPPGPGFDRL